MRHDDLPIIAALAFITNLTCGCFAMTFIASLDYNVWAMLAILFGMSTLVSLVIVTYYAFFGGYPIRKKKIEETLGQLKG